MMSLRDCGSSLRLMRWRKEKTMLPRKFKEIIDPERIDTDSNSLKHIFGEGIRSFLVLEFFSLRSPLMAVLGIYSN